MRAHVLMMSGHATADCFARTNAKRAKLTSPFSRGLKQDFIEADARSGQPFEMMKYSIGSYGAQFCEIRVNEQSGEARVSRWVGAFDTGRILNPKTAPSQFMGGIIMGIGMAVTEETFF